MTDKGKNTLSDKDQMEVLSRLAFGDLAGAREYANQAIWKKKRRARHPGAPYCSICKHMVQNMRPTDPQYAVGKIDGKRRKRHMKHGDAWCLNGTMFRINKNHRRWWGFDRRCPLNPHTHTCEVCGQRMCTYDEMCCVCKKNRQYL